MDVSSFTRCRILDGNMSSLTLRGGRVDAPTFHLDRRNAHAVCFGTECWNTFCLHSAAQKTMNLFFTNIYFSGLQRRTPNSADTGALRSADAQYAVFCPDRFREHSVA